MQTETTVTEPSQVPTIAAGSGPTRRGPTPPVRGQAPDVFGNIFIGIAGMIGAGKSTLATALGQHLGIDAYYEPVADNEYLADFYRDTARYSFAMQVYLLNRRFQQHQEIIWRGKLGGAGPHDLRGLDLRQDARRRRASWTSATTARTSSCSAT